jgi:hypothetical protein
MAPPIRAVPVPAIRRLGQGLVKAPPCPAMVSAAGAARHSDKDALAPAKMWIAAIESSATPPRSAERCGATVCSVVNTAGGMNADIETAHASRRL